MQEPLHFEFAKALGIGMEVNLNFYVAALDTFKASNSTMNRLRIPQEPLVIYQSIQLRCVEDRV